MRAIAAAAAVLAVVVLGACGDSKEPTGPQKLDLEIGNLFPMTGYFDPFGKSGERSANVAAEEIRKAIAKAGAQHKVQIHNIDYKSDPGPAIKLSEKLVKNGSSCLTGLYGAGHAARTGALVGAPQKALLITPSASGKQITDVQDRGYLASLAPTDTVQIEALVEHMSNKLGGAKGKKVNVGYLDGTYGKTLLKQFKEAWTDKGGTVGRTATYRSDSTLRHGAEQRAGGGQAGRMALPRRHRVLHADRRRPRQEEGVGLESGQVLRLGFAGQRAPAGVSAGDNRRAQRSRALRAGDRQGPEGFRLGLQAHWWCEAPELRRPGVRRSDPLLPGRGRGGQHQG